MKKKMCAFLVELGSVRLINVPWTVDPSHLFHSSPLNWPGLILQFLAPVFQPFRTEMLVKVEKKHRFAPIVVSKVTDRSLILCGCNGFFVLSGESNEAHELRVARTFFLRTNLYFLR